MKFTLIIYVLFFSIFSINAQNDTLVFNNKNQIVGEIKQMEQGVLVFSTDYSDSDFQIKWKDIYSINSVEKFVIMLRDGTRLNSSFETLEKDDPNKVSLNKDGEQLILPLSSVVYIKEYDMHFLSRLNGSFSVGYNFTKSNSLTQFSFIGDIDYLADRWNLSSTINMIINDQNDADVTKRSSANVGSRYFFKKDWFFSLKLDFLSNDEQKLKLRTNVQAGAGNYFVRTNKWYLAGGVGVAYNVERYTDTSDNDLNSYEAFFIVDSNIFDVGDLDVYANITGYPSITEKGRFRSDISLTAKYSLPLDLFIKVSYSTNFDNQPVAGASKSDYVLQTSFGWSP